MARKRRSPAETREKLERFEDFCRDQGLRITHQRREIFRELAAADNHPSAEILYRRLRSGMPTISLDTIYRTLATFERCDLISRVQTIESQGRFEAETRPHHHLVCDRCRQITDVGWQSFDNAALPAGILRWGRVETRNVIFRGVCRKCLRSARTAAGKVP